MACPRQWMAISRRSENVSMVTSTNSPFPPCCEIVSRQTSLTALASCATASDLHAGLGGLVLDGVAKHAHQARVLIEMKHDADGYVTHWTEPRSLRTLRGSRGSNISRPHTGGRVLLALAVAAIARSHLQFSSVRSHYEHFHRGSPHIRPRSLRRSRKQLPSIKGR